MCESTERDALRALVSSECALKFDEPLARRTTLRVGGPADIFAEPASEQDLASLLTWCREREVPMILLGRGSNLLIRDKGFRGMVIHLGAPEFSRVTADGLRLICGAGARLKVVANEARRQGIGGLEFLEGIPGSVGGALRMNAGAMGGEMFDRVVSVRFMSLKGEVAELTAGEIPHAYRSCEHFRDHIAISAVLEGLADSPEAIDERMRESSRKRWDSQPAASSAGCMFKNPESIPAGKLIDELGLKDTRVGGVRVSDVHGNFIVNDHNGTAADVLALIELIRKRALEERGIDLHPEVQVIGEEE